MAVVNMSSIIIGFSKPKAWFEPFSWLIRLVTWSPFSHAYIKYFNPYAQKWIVFQASGLKLNFVEKSRFENIENIYSEFEIPISESAKLNTVQFAIDSIGESYGFLQVVGFGFVLIMKVFGKKVKNPFYTTSSFFCSELVSQILNEINGSDLDVSSMSPKDLYDYIVSKGYKPN